MSALDLHRTEVDGTTIIWADSSLPFVCSLLVRVGKLDETLITSGMSHLLEHMVLSTDWPVEDFNARVEPLFTHFWFAGTQAVALDRLAATMETMSRPPLARLPREREILGIEEYGRGRSVAGVHNALRFGATGLGLYDYPEHGVRRATRSDVLAWSRQFYTRDNSVVFMNREPPSSIGVGLPEGARAAISPPRPIPYVEYPSSYVHGLDGSAGISMLVSRTYAIRVAAEVLIHRLRQWLRHREGVTYHVGEAYEPITREQAHLTIWADCRPSNASLVRGAMVAALDDLAADGPTDEELAIVHESFRRGALQDDAVYDRLHHAAVQHLLDEPVVEPEEAVAERESLSAADVASAVAEGFTSLLVSAPPETPHLGGRFRPYAIDSPHDIGGKRFAPTDDELHETLAISDVGASVSGHSRRTCLFDEVEAFATWDDGSVGMWSADGFYVLVDPADWRDGEEAAALVRAKLVPALVVDISSPPLSFEDADLLAAAAAYDAEDWERAATLFEQGLGNEPEEAEAWRMLAWARYKAGDPARAIEAAREAARLDAHDAWSMSFLALRLLDAYQPLDAAASAREAVRRAPVELQVLVEASDVLVRVGDSERALAIGRRAAELYADESRAWFAYGWSSRAASQWARAEEALRRAVELAPDVSMWHNNLGALLLDVGRAGEALESFDLALQLDSDNRFATTNRALALHLLGRRREAAKSYLKFLRRRLDEAQKELAGAPDDPALLERVARALYSLERDEDALARTEAALAVQPTAGRYVLLGAILARLNRLEDQRTALEAAIELDPEHPSALEDLAWVSSLLGDAEAAASAAARMRSELARRAMFARGYAAVAAKNWSDAEQIFDELTRLQPLSCCALAWRGMARVGSGQIEAARSDAEKVHSVALASCASVAQLERLLAER